MEDGLTRPRGLRRDRREAIDEHFVT